jgi:hypothetical protein
MVIRDEAGLASPKQLVLSVLMQFGTNIKTAFIVNQTKD